MCQLGVLDLDKGELHIHAYTAAVSRKVMPYKRGKLLQQCQKLLWVMVVLRLLGRTSRCFSVVEGNSTNTHIPSFLFLVSESP